jgi:hypothetical protein
MHWIDTLQTSFFFGGKLLPLAEEKEGYKEKKDPKYMRMISTTYFHVCGIKETRVSRMNFAM